MDDTALLAAATMIGLFAPIVGAFVRAMLPRRPHPHLHVVRGNGPRRIAPEHVALRRRRTRVRARTGAAAIATLDPASRVPASRAR
jgi:hypothetical protein